MDPQLTFLLVLVGVIVNTTHSAEPICCMPKIYSILGGFQVGTNAGGHPTGIQGVTAVFSDSNQKRIAMQNIYWINGSQKGEEYDILLDFKDKIMYVVEDKTKKCTTSELEAEWTPPCIPGTAAFMGHSYFGEQNTTNFLMTDSYWFTTEKIPVFIVKTQGDGCIPVSESYTTGNSMVAMSYFNYTTEVDPGEFDVPDACKDQKLFFLPARARNSRTRARKFKKVFSPTTARNFKKVSMFTGAYA